ncbi:hypothetical protein K469DRAFT_746970 [Zopfia rhizophila CBS 207.26]|uniref:Uncharacterized protein n=1 Tax=Zopfia rhizophila CBS 207.26 TaxID=1314779 RepID=A0A6A6EKR7_9PEZI|nr:hypothetical protein K469DRAFT_746970 [Zopfia rhizophila CBS 207.26]
MDPVTSLGVAAGVIQLVQFVTKLLSTTSAIQRAGSSTLPVFLDLESITKKLGSLSEQLSEDIRKTYDLERAGLDLSSNDKDLQQLCSECSALSQKILTALQSAKKSKSNGKWSSFYKALKSVWAESEIEYLNKRLQGFREQIILHIVVSLRQRDNIAICQQSRMMETVEQIDKQMQTITRKSWNTLSEKKRWQDELILDIMSDNKALDEEAAYPIASEFCDSTSFVGWLKAESGPSLYWIAGKAGSGKSTLMKFLAQHPETQRVARIWSGQERILISAFYFWNSGTSMQKSHEGLLRTLLYHCFSQRPELIPYICPIRWDVCRQFGVYTNDWTRTELLEAFKAFVIKVSQDTRICFVIDGLDEFEGSHDDQLGLIQFLRGISRIENVKMCVSSRPWPIFKDAFGHDPSLMLQHLTFKDMQVYVNTMFGQNRGFAELRLKDSAFTSELESSIVRKSSGMWLWLYLVVRSLTQGRTDGVRISDLQKIIDGLPEGIEDLFKKMLESLEHRYQEQSSQIFQIFRACKEQPSLLFFSYADEDTSDYALNLQCYPIDAETHFGRAEAMNRRLNSLTRGLLEVTSTMSEMTTSEDAECTPFRSAFTHMEVSDSNSFSEEYKSTLKLSKVGYLHRTVKDYIERPDTWDRICDLTDETFNVNVSLLKAYVCVLKTSLTASPMFWRIISTCLTHAFRASSQSECAAKTVSLLLDELDSATQKICPQPGLSGSYGSQVRPSEDGNCKLEQHWTHFLHLDPKNICRASFLGLCVRYRLHTYVLQKLDQGALIEQGVDCYSLLDCAILPSIAHPATSNALETRADHELDVAILQPLLQRGADPNRARRPGTKTPWENILIRAWTCPASNIEWPDIARTFLKFGADPNVAFERGFPGDEAVA